MEIKDKVFSLRMKSSVYNAVAILAGKKDRTPNYLINKIVEDYLKKHVKNKGAKNENE